MSYFNSDGNQPPNPATPPANPANPADYVAEVVKAKGDQWANPQVLAKGKLEADTHIAGLENQLTELRSELDKQDYASELLTQLKDQGKPPAVETPSAPTGGTGQEPTAPTLSEDELKNLIVSTLTNQKAEDVKQSNLRVVDEKLNQLYGTEVDKVMDKRSSELGITKERLQDMASDSPTAFFALLGEPVKKTEAPTPHSVINTSADSFTSTGGDRDWAYYQKLKKEDRHAYFKPAIQRQLLDDKKRLGANFGN